MDTQLRGHLRDDLRGLVKGELLFDDISRSLYSTDASIFEVEPAGVVAPRDEADVRAVLRYCAEHAVPVVPRGAATGVAGESLGDGVIIDLSRHFRGILGFEDDLVRVQPGVVLRDLNVFLSRFGRRFAPDPASGGQCTIGGMLATNASGSTILRHGYTRDHVAGLRVCLDTGEVITVGSPPWPNQGEPPSRLATIVDAVGSLLESNQTLIRESGPRTPFNRCGYLLHDVATPRGPDLVKLLVGSEGTLGVFTEATLRTVRVPASRSAVLVGFGRLDDAIRAAQLALPTEPAACDLLDRRLLSLARGGDARLGHLISQEVEAVVLILYESDEPVPGRGEQAAEAVRDVIDRLRRRSTPLAVIPALATDEVDSLWRLRELAMPGLYGIRGGAQPLALVEDVGVPVDALSEYVRGVQEVLKRHETTASFLIHAGSGQVHTRPFLDLQKPADVSTLWAIAEEVHSLALDLGGTVSTQHGTGLARTPWVSRQYRRLYPVFRQLKAIFDPGQILNPGKIIGPLPGQPTWPLRRVPPAPVAPADRVPPDADLGQEPEPEVAPEVAPEAPRATHLRWAPGELRQETINCNGCGQCRTGESPLRMCPVFRADPSEAASPRAKANLMRYLLLGEPAGAAPAGGAPPPPVGSSEVREVADLCVNCRMCAVECPAHVNVPKLMLEAKAANVADHGLPRTDWVLSRPAWFAALGSTLAPLANAALRSSLARWVLEKLVGVSRRRRLPAFAARTFFRIAERRGWTRPAKTGRRRFAYFVDVFANYNDPPLAEAVVQVLRHNDLGVFVPARQQESGMAALVAGDVDRARGLARDNVHLLADFVRDGYDVVCSEPTAALMLTQCYPDLSDHPDTRLVADHTLELTAVLGEAADEGRFATDFRPVEASIGYHLPCHLKALGRPPAGPGLLARIPGLRVHTIDVSCSGMAGTFGLKAEAYDLSLAAGGPMLREFKRPGVLFGCTECSTCRMQMEDGGGKRTLHPAQYLALAYGLMPELARRLREPIGDLVLAPG